MWHNESSEIEACRRANVIYAGATSFSIVVLASLDAFDVTDM